MTLQEARPYIVLSIVVMGVSVAFGTALGWMIKPTSVVMVQQPQITEKAPVDAPVATTTVIAARPLSSHVMLAVKDVFVRRIGVMTLDVSTSTKGGGVLRMRIDERTLFSKRKMPIVTTAALRYATGTFPMPSSPEYGPELDTPAIFSDMQVGAKVQIYTFSGERADTAFSVAILE